MSKKNKGMSKKNKDLDGCARDPRIRSQLEKLVPQKFYPGYDKYKEIFDVLAKEAEEQHPSLIGVFQISDNQFENLDLFVAKKKQLKRLSRFGFKANEGKDYIDRKGYGRRAALRGVTIYFREKDDPKSLKTCIAIARNVNRKESDERKQGYKIAALLHEIGHVTDAEKNIHIDVENQTIDLIDAEVFAHVYAFEKMAEMELHVPFLLLKSQLQGVLNERDTQLPTICTIAERVLAKIPKHEFSDWTPHYKEAFRLARMEFKNALGTTGTGTT